MNIKRQTFHIEITNEALMSTEYVLDVQFGEKHFITVVDVGDNKSISFFDDDWIVTPVDVDDIHRWIDRALIMFVLVDEG